MTHLAVGRQITMTDRIDPARAAALHATLGCEGNPPGKGDALPAFWHWIQFWTVQASGGLGRDGHPRPGGFIPDTGLPRRMWAGGRLRFHQPLSIGETATKTSTIKSVVNKTGRSGPLCFVTVLHEIAGASGIAISEEQDLVFREDPKAGAGPQAPKQARRDEDTCAEYSFDTTMLFRYSALTFNGHRIHYDLDYCRDVEGYPGIVVHGPLLAQLLVQMAGERLGRLTEFSFRALSPVFHQERVSVCAGDGWDEMELWVRAQDGRLAMTASAR